MSDNGDPNKLYCVTVILSNAEGKIEKLPTVETGHAMVRISCWSLDHLHSQPLDISETDLVALLQKALRAGILSPDFLENLRSEIEI